MTLSTNYFEQVIEERRQHDPEMLGKAWDYAKVRWAYHMAKTADAHDWEDDMTCRCHGWTPDDIMRLVV